MEKCYRCGQRVQQTEMIDFIATCEPCSRAAIADRFEETLSCPKDGAAMTKQEVSGVMVDQCPKCGGIWLDAGELEELLQESARKGQSARVAAALFMV